MPPTAKTKTPLATPMEPPRPKPSVASLPPLRADAIGQLTARARTLHRELLENSAKADAFQFRNAALRRELLEIDKQVREHAWDGQPIT